MGRKRWIWPVLGAAVSAGVLLGRSQRRRRLLLAHRACSLTQEALASLGVAAQSTTLPGDGIELHAVLAGPEDGPLAVLLHGFPECWYSWRHQIPVLARAGYRVVAVDQRGYNLSDKPRGVRHYQVDLLAADIVTLIHSLGREAATLVAHDWGGLAAWRLAMDYPQVVDKLVILNAPHPVAMARALRRDGSQRLRSWYIFLFQLPWLPETVLTLSPLGSARFAFQRTAVRRDAFSETDLEILAAALAQPDAMRCMIDYYRAALRFRPARRASPVRAPTLVLWAEDDFALGKELTYGLERGVPDLTLHTIANCGHWVQNEAPVEVNEQMMAFLQRT
jgi:pimeloyl-ACP methyl ester carboxylesterase